MPSPLAWPFRSRALRVLLWLLLIVAVALGAFLLGLRSAIQKDRAYFWTKEIKVLAYHEYNALKDRFRIRSNFRKRGVVDAVKVYNGNDFTLELGHVADIGHTEKTAGFVTDAKGELVKYEQADVAAHWEQAGLSAALPGVEPTRFRGGGLKQIFQHQGQTLALVSLKGPRDCYFASLVNLTQRKEVFRAPCLPPVEELDFSSIGGAWAAVPGGILMSLGTPSDDPRVAMLAQQPDSPYGKVLRFADNRLVTPPDTDAARAAFAVHSSGHRNPQGMVRVGEAVYAIDHGPKGGDEINLLREGRNYGWPLYSLGSSYQGKPHQPVGDAARFEAPLHAFVPSVAPSDITTCPTHLAERYAPLTCLLITSLRGQSLFVTLVDANHRVLSLERVTVDMRLREFLNLPEGKLGVSTDDYGVFELSVIELARY